MDKFNKKGAGHMGGGQDSSNKNQQRGGQGERGGHGQQKDNVGQGGHQKGAKDKDVSNSSLISNMNKNRNNNDRNNNNR